MADHSHSTKAVDKSVYKIGNRTALILAAITIIEFVVAIYSSSAVFLLLLAAAKAYFVMNIFMGMPRLWRGEEHH